MTIGYHAISNCVVSQSEGILNTYCLSTAIATERYVSDTQLQTGT